MGAYIEFRDVKKIYKMGEVSIEALAGVNFSIDKGEFVVIAGASGAGKSTILNILGGMDTATSGTIIVDGNRVSDYTSKQLTTYRRYDIGFVFQFYNLVPNLTVKENIQVCQYLTKNPLNMEELLQVLGLTEHQNKFPAQLSGGQQQRVAIARAVVSNPKLILADEPTGNLDSKNGAEVMNLLTELNKEGTSIVMVTHSQHDAGFAHRVIHLFDGSVVANIKE